jgi:hypothetical protein
VICITVVPYAVVLELSMRVELIEAFRKDLARGEQPTQVILFIRVEIVVLFYVVDVQNEVGDVDLDALVKKREMVDAVSEFAWDAEKEWYSHI